MEIRQARIRGFDLATYTAKVEILGSYARYLAGVPVAHHINPGHLIAGAECAVIFFAEGNACVAFVSAQPGQAAQTPLNYVQVTPAVELVNIVNSSSIDWTAVDLSGEVSPSAVEVNLQLRLRDTGQPPAKLRVTKYGLRGVQNYIVLFTCLANEWNAEMGTVPVDDQRRIEYWLSATGANTASFTIYLRGYYEPAHADQFSGE